jgi:hypothetical protein
MRSLGWCNGSGGWPEGRAASHRLPRGSEVAAELRCLPVTRGLSVAAARQLVACCQWADRCPNGST